jgi:hypothetical protein
VLDNSKSTSSWVVGQHVEAKQYFQAAQQRHRQWAEKIRQPAPDIEPGDQVLLSMKHFKLYEGFKVKLAPRYVAPLKVLDCIGPRYLAYRLELPQHWRIHNVFHVSALKPYHSDGQYQPPPSPQYIDGEVEYEVNLTESTRLEGKRRFYLVQRFGYPNGQTWEPELHLTNCDETLQAIWK